MTIFYAAINSSSIELNIADNMLVTTNSVSLHTTLYLYIYLLPYSHTNYYI